MEKADAEGEVAVALLLCMRLPPPPPCLLLLQIHQRRQRWKKPTRRARWRPVTGSGDGGSRISDDFFSPLLSSPLWRWWWWRRWRSGGDSGQEGGQDYFFYSLKTLGTGCRVAPIIFIGAGSKSSTNVIGYWCHQISSGWKNDPYDRFPTGANGSLY